MNAKANDLATVDTVSQVLTRFPAKTSENWGKYLTGEALGGRDLKFGPSVLVGDGRVDVPPTTVASLFCSQQ